MPPVDPETARWFATELQPHEEMLRAWLRAQFPGMSDLDDIIQDSYLRVLQAHARTPLGAPKAYLFATARNAVLMQLRHRATARTDSFPETELCGILDEAADTHQAVARAQELELLTKAIQSLPARCRQIFTLRKIYGMSQKAIAAELGVSENTVESQGTIALRKLGEYFARHGNP